MHTVDVTVINARVHRWGERQHRVFVHNSFVCFTVCDIVRAPQLALCVWEKRPHAADCIVCCIEVGGKDLRNTFVTVSGNAATLGRGANTFTNDRAGMHACMHAQPVTRKWCDRGVCCGRERYLPLRGGKKRASRRSLLWHEGVVVSVKST